MENAARWVGNFQGSRPKAQFARRLDGKGRLHSAAQKMAPGDLLDLEPMYSSPLLFKISMRSSAL
jgi:hypothetical protein